MNDTATFIPGISVIVPTFQGAGYLHNLLESLEQQTLNRSLFEVIFVLNGPEDGSRALLDRFCAENSSINIRLLESSTAGASRARNLGLASVSRQYVTFVDDDDLIEPRYLEAGLRAAAPGVCALLPMVDLVRGERIESTTLGLRIIGLQGTTQIARSIPWAFGFNASKVIPSDLITNYRYKESLQSGEDIVFFSQLLQAPNLAIRVPKIVGDEAYIRTQRDGSISRKTESFEFSVVQRLQVIRELRATEVPEACRGAIRSLETSQFTFIRDYLVKHPEQVQNAIDIAMSFKISGLQWEGLRTETARRLVVSYCFPPYSDTSANVAAKTIIRQGELVDVISANMSRVRKKDSSSLLMVEPYIARSKELNVDPSFASWPMICSFARKALKQANKWSKRGPLYTSMYSRALWSGSHVAAALVKLSNPALYWEAEFSDPLRVGADGELREGKITPGLTTRKLRKVVEQSGWSDIEVPSHFVLTEVVTLLLADEIVFTNAQQQNVMLAPYPPDFQSAVKAKSIIRAHALPSRKLFELGTVKADIVPGKVNIAYFGNFYGNRGIGEIANAIRELDADTASEFVLHLYCNNPAAVELMQWESETRIDLRTYSFLSYLDFLATSDWFDVLLVNDTDISQTRFCQNPFLPSKYADYAASRAPVWGIVSPGSPLSEKPLDFVSITGNKQSVQDVLFRLKADLG